jgi:hypothetical protein
MGIHGTKVPLGLFKIHLKKIQEGEKEVEDYQLQKFFKWIQNIVNSQTYSKIKN